MTSAERIVELEVENATLRDQVRALKARVREWEQWSRRMTGRSILMTTEQLMSLLHMSRRQVLYRIHRVPRGRYGNNYVATVNDVMYWNSRQPDVPPPPPNGLR